MFSRKTQIAVCLAVVTLANADTTQTNSSPTETGPGKSVQTHIVTVGKVCCPEKTASGSDDDC